MSGYTRRGSLEPDVWVIQSEPDGKIHEITDDERRARNVAEQVAENNYQKSNVYMHGVGEGNLSLTGY
jgi:hypothetical protein